MTMQNENPWGRNDWAARVRAPEKYNAQYRQTITGRYVDCASNGRGGTAFLHHVRGRVGRMDASVVRGVRGLTARWVREVGGGSTVVSGLGVWPLLGILATAADEPGRAELAEAIGVDAVGAASAAGELIAALDGPRDLRAALGVWVSDTLKLAESFDSVVPVAARGTLTGDLQRDKAALDAWASEHTDGLIPRMPLELTKDTVLALASALSLKTTWVRPFGEHPYTIDSGPWAGTWQWLSRNDPDLSTIRTYDDTSAGTLVTVTVKGEQDVDVVLGLGPQDAPAASVVPALVEAAGEPGADGHALLATARAGEELAPGLTVTPALWAPDVQLALPQFEIRAEHDLLKYKDIFGLAAVSTEPQDGGWFGGITPEPLWVSQAKQAVLARFYATGFEAAAVTAFGMVGAAAVTPKEVKGLRLDLDRPFAFVAIHRETRLPIVAGWVAEPTDRAQV